MKLAVAAVLAASLSVLAYGDVQEFDYKWEHPRLTIVRLQDATDAHDELLFTTEYVLSRCERTFDVEAPALFIEDVLTGDGMAFFRKAPLPHARTDKTPDFRVDARRRRITVNATAYPCVRVPYTGGAAGHRAVMLHEAHVEGGSGDVTLPLDRNEFNDHVFVPLFCCCLCWLVAPFASEISFSRVGKSNPPCRESVPPV